MNYPYCIKHEHSTMLQNSQAGDCHEVLFFNEYGQLDIDWCMYELGWAMSEPPEVDPDWELDIVEPSPEELELMDSEFVV